MMRQHRYSGDPWAGTAVHPALRELLLQKNILLEITSGPPPYPVVLGVPHHAAPQVDRIAENWTNPRTRKPGRPADEMAGLLGLTALAALDEAGVSTRLVIAIHPTDHDPNKLKGCPYWESILATPLPALLFELHGAGDRRRHDLELSAGRNQHTDPLSFGRHLAPLLSQDWSLAVQARPGSGEAHLLSPDHNNGRIITARLENPALSTPLLSYASELKVKALHLETKAFFRQPDPTFPHTLHPTADAWRLARALAAAVQAFI